IGDEKSFGLSVAQVFQADRWYFGPAQQPARHDATMARDNLALRVDQHRDVEAKGLDAARDLTNLARTVKPRVSWVEPKLADGQVSDRDSAARYLSRLRVLKLQ